MLSERTEGVTEARNRSVPDFGHGRRIPGHVLNFNGDRFDSSSKDKVFQSVCSLWSQAHCKEDNKNNDTEVLNSNKRRI